MLNVIRGRGVPSETQAHILGMIVRGEKIERVLSELSTHIEGLIPGSIAGVTVLDRAARTFELAVFPSLEATFAQAIPGLHVADQPGTCATAIYRGETVTSNDIATDTRFQDEWRTLSLQHGVKSIQSRPVFAADGTSLGTFVVGFREPRPLEAFDEYIVELGSELAGLALSHYRATQQQSLLVAELQHRTKNLFASIGALVYFTLRANPDPIEFRKVFDGRLAALSNAHSLALNHHGVELKSLIGDVLAPYGGAARITLSGPPFTLTPDAAVAFSLATHELATNATKYGALSNDDGRLDVTWDVERDNGGERIFQMQWAERGGPAVLQPGKTGFGRNTIEKSLAQAVDGNVVLDFAPDGLICTIQAPLTERLGSAADLELA